MRWPKGFVCSADIDMSTPVSKEWFSATIRRNRQSYFLSNVILISIVATILSIAHIFCQSEERFFVIFLLFGIPYVLCQYFLTGQRLRDLNLSGWLALLWMPVHILDSKIDGTASLIFWILLCSLPGTAGTNRYGPDPLLSDSS